MAFKHVVIFPIIATVIALTAIFTAYGIAVANDDVDPWIPFISDCGTVSPEKNIFSGLLQLAAFFMFITMYLIHRSNISYYEENDIELGGWKTYSCLVMLVGFLSLFGASIVADFPESDILTVHLTGAMVFFIGMIIYFWLLLIFYYSQKETNVPSFMIHFRLLLTLCQSAVLIFDLYVSFASPFGKLEKKDWPYNIQRPKKGDSGYYTHMSAALAEWVLVWLIVADVLTYAYDFSLVHLRPVILARVEDSTASLRSNLNKNNGHTNHAYDGYNTRSAAYEMNTIGATSDIQSTRRLPRIDKIYTGGTVQSVQSTYSRNVVSRPYDRF